MVKRLSKKRNAELDAMVEKHAAEMVEKYAAEAAYHEAGHSAILFFIGHGSHLVDLKIFKKGISLGKLLFETSTSGMERLWPFFGAIHHVCLHLLGGLSAERKYRGLNGGSFELYESFRDISTDDDGKIALKPDFHRIEELAGCHYKTFPRRGKFIRKMCQRIDEIMEIPEIWGLVEDVAKILLKQRKMSAAEFNTIALAHFKGEHYPNNNKKWSAMLYFWKGQTRPGPFVLGTNGPPKLSYYPKQPRNAVPHE